MALKIRRIIGVLLLLSAVIITQLPVQENFAAGNADEFQMNNGTLIKYTGTASTVSVSDTVKIIGEEAFAGNLGVNTVSCGTNTKELRFGAFANCTYLTKVSLPDTTEIIDNSVFSGCENLTKINFGKNMSSLGDGVFAGCNSLKDITVDKDNTHFVVENGAVYNKDKTILYAYLNGNTASSYKMPDTVEKIKEYAFWGNENLSSITLSDSLKEIPGYAFANCKNLDAISISYSVHSIDAKAFENCISLKDTTIPSSVSYIDSTAFDGCHKLNILADAGSVADIFFQGFDKSDVTAAEEDDTKEVVVSSNTAKDKDNESVSENDSAAETPANLVDASNDPSNVEYMPKSDPLSGIEDSSVIAKTIVVNGNAVLFLNRNEVSLNQGIISNPADESDSNDTEHISQEESTIYDPQKGGYLPKYTEVGNSIAMQAYYGDNTLSTYSFPSGIHKIGEFSFARSALTSIQIPDGVTDISYGAFYHCDALTNVTIPSSVNRIAANAFEKTPWLSNWKSNQDGNDFLIVGNHILLAYKGSSANIEIPQGVLTIAPGCFNGHTELQSVYLPDSLKVIGEEAFYNCSSLKDITGGNFVESIGDRAYSGCPIHTFTIPSTVKSMGLQTLNFEKTGKEDKTKAVIFEGNVLPNVLAGQDSMRLKNDDYRKDVLYNVLFAVVEENCNTFENTVLDENKLGFSGMILSIEKNDDGSETGYVTVKKNNIFNESVLKKLPTEVVIKGKTYQIKDYDNIALAKAPVVNGEKTSKVTVQYNNEINDAVNASFSEDEAVGILNISESEEAENHILKAYQELFAGDVTAMKGYDISLTDSTGTVPINRFGKAVLSITMPIPDGVSGDTYHAVCLDADNQLEEAAATVNKEAGTITFEASHLSEYGIYATTSDVVTLQLKNGSLVPNLKKDVSPNTGDYSIPIKIPLVLAFVSAALLLIFVRGKK